LLHSESTFANQYVIAVDFKRNGRIKNAVRLRYKKVITQIKIMQLLRFFPTRNRRK